MNDTDALKVLAQYCADLGYEVPCDYLPDVCDYCDNNCEDKIEGSQWPNVDCWIRYAREYAKEIAEDVPDTNVGMMCEDAISRDVVLLVLDESRIMQNPIGYAKHKCKTLPSVNPVAKDNNFPTKQGEWVHHSTGWVSCSCCQTAFPKLDRYDFMYFCPCCGKKLRDGDYFAEQEKEEDEE